MSVTTRYSDGHITSLEYMKKPSGAVDRLASTVPFRNCSCTGLPLYEVSLESGILLLLRSKKISPVITVQFAKDIVLLKGITAVWLVDVLVTLPRKGTNELFDGRVCATKQSSGPEWVVSKHGYA